MARVILLSHRGLTSTLESELACHILVSALQSSWWSLSFLRARIWPDLWVFLLLPVMHLMLFLLPHSSQHGCHLLQIPALLSTSSPGAPVMIRRFRNTGKSSCDTLGGSTDSAFPSQGGASLCRHKAQLAAIICWESEPSNQGREAHGIQEMLWAVLLHPIFKGEQGMDSSLWSVLASSICMKYLGKVCPSLALDFLKILLQDAKIHQIVCLQSETFCVAWIQHH